MLRMLELLPSEREEVERLLADAEMVVPMKVTVNRSNMEVVQHKAFDNAHGNDATHDGKTVVPARASVRSGNPKLVQHHI